MIRETVVPCPFCSCDVPVPKPTFSAYKSKRGRPFMHRYDVVFRDDKGRTTTRRVAADNQRNSIAAARRRWPSHKTHEHIKSTRVPESEWKK